MTVAGVLLAMLLAANAPAGEVDEVRSAVEQWLKQLDAPTLAERARAERELLDLGPKILPWLPPNELLRNASTREAVKSLRIQLQRRLARDSARPSRVTLNGEYRLPELLTEITRQTSNTLQLDERLPASALTARSWMFEDVTFWEALDEICRTLRLKQAAAEKADGILLTTGSEEGLSRPVCRVGVMRAELSLVQQQDIAGDPSRKLTRVQGELALEPRLRPLFVHFKEGDFSATDAEGQPLENWNPLARYELPLAARRTKVQWDFVTPADAAPKKVSLRGRVLVHLAAATEQIRFDQLSENREVLRRRGGVSVRLHQAEFSETEGNRAATVKVTVNYDAGGPAFESHRTWVYHNAAWMEDARSRYPFTDFDALQQTDGSVQLEYRFERLPGGNALKFVYEAPTLLLDVPFDVEFAGVEVE